MVEENRLTSNLVQKDSSITIEEEYLQFSIDPLNLS